MSVKHSLTNGNGGWSAGISQNLEDACPKYAEALGSVRSFSDLPHDIVVDDLFQHQAERNPASIAVELWSSTQAKVTACWTYSELHAVVVSIADELIEAGIGRGHTVGVLMDRGVHGIAMALVASKIGATLVNMEVSWPQARIEVTGTAENMRTSLIDPVDVDR